MPVLMAVCSMKAALKAPLKAMEYRGSGFYSQNHEQRPRLFRDELRRKVKAIARKKTIVKLKYRRINHIVQPLAHRSQPSQPADYVQTPCHGPRDLVVIGVFHGRTAGRAESSFRPAR